MKKTALIFSMLVLGLILTAPAARAQGSANRGPDPSTLRDPELEKDSMHNLEVARHYYKQKKAYLAAVKRCEEIIAGNPTFARIDEVLYIAAMSSLRLSENKGKQKQTAISTEKLREDARDYLTKLVSLYPDSSFREMSEKELRSLGGAKAKEQ
jgi:outer membrane protein assembly factor BamD (BamD/ComL family)